MKRLIIAAALLTSFGVSANDFCRVVTFSDWTVTSAKGVHKENLKEDGAIDLFMSVGGNVFYEQANPADYTKLMGVTYLGKMQDSHFITASDSNNVNTFSFEPHTDSFYENDVFIPDEQQRGMNFDSSAQIIRGKYKTCTVNQRILLSDDFRAFSKQYPFIVNE